ncbi:glycolate oxidase subunit GlcF [Nitrosomonas sp.]|uniref:glycolate oxidase subunit GlcF n=1 Tax=Nitrosomonas sp. TaxID=42353 RepID=UPI0035B019ED
MQTKLADFIKNSPEGQEADEILRSCVHCGFCLATCPTYQLLGDELDSPRGRIYLMKQLLEGQPVTEKTQLHLDRCLTCRACETTCPSGVRYGALVDIGRGIVEKQVKRNLYSEVMRFTLRKVLPNALLFNTLFKAGQLVRPMLPSSLKKKIPARLGTAQTWPAARHARAMLVLDGCVQPALAPNINAACARVLDRLGISLIKAEKAGCCGAVTFHLNAQTEGLDYMRRNIDAWWPYVEQEKAEAIVMTASGCGVTVKDYGHLLSHDREYAEKAATISAMTKDISEILLAEKDRLRKLTESKKDGNQTKLAFHSPCTLQHGLKIRGTVEQILVATGFDLTVVPNAHLCCGSAGTYSILQPELSQQLLKNKVDALESGQPDQIATANIGCLMHLQNGAAISVKHWIELIDQRLSAL